MASHGDRTAYAVTLERGTDGSYLAWVNDLPRLCGSGLLPGKCARLKVTVVVEVESVIEADEDTEAPSSLPTALYSRTRIGPARSGCRPVA